MRSDLGFGRMSLQLCDSPQKRSELSHEELLQRSGWVMVRSQKQQAEKKQEVGEQRRAPEPRPQALDAPRRVRGERATVKRDRGSYLGSAQKR